MNLNQDAQTKIEEEINGALKMLSEMQPPAAMASRIHERLALAAANSKETRRNRLFWAPVAGVAVAAVLLAVVSQTHWMRGKPRPVVETAKMMATDSVSPRLASARPELAPERSHEREVSVPKIHPGREHSQYRHVANLFNYPLTQQEKLLVRFVQTATPEELQELNPKNQEKIEAQQEAEFDAYLKSGSNFAQGTKDIKQFTQE